MFRRVLVLASLTFTTLAHANGRPPVTNGVFLQPNDPQALYIRTTFGLLISHDDGCSFRWVCEQDIGYGGFFDPEYAIAADGTLFATTFDGLRVSHDGGCSFTTATAQLPAGAPGRIADIWVDTIDLGPTGEVWVATADSGKTNDVYRSTDNGVTFTSRGLASTTIFWKSVKVAPSDPLRVYASGYELSPTPTAYLSSTVDGGDHWTAGSLAGVQFAATPQVTIAAVDPANPQHLFLVSIGANDLGDRLYRSLDGGASFAEVLATTQPIVNVVIRDATTVLVASGNGGSFRSDDAGATFAPVANAPRLGCLGKRADGSLVGCAANWDPDFMAVGRSDDMAQWQKMFRFIELGGPLACPAGTPGHDICDVQMWPALRAQFGATGPTCPTATDLPNMGADMTPPSMPGGCCDASDGSPIGLALLALVTSWMLGLRRRPVRAR